MLGKKRSHPHPWALRPLQPFARGFTSHYSLGWLIGVVGVGAFGRVDVDCVVDVG